MNYDKMWEEIGVIANEANEINQKPHEKTIHTLVREWGMSKKDARSVLSQLIEQGIMCKREAKCVNGRMATVYYPSASTEQTAP